jgi:hypothetical protein
MPDPSKGASHCDTAPALASRGAGGGDGMIDAQEVFAGTSFGAWWAVAESAAQALGYGNVQDDPQLVALVTVLLRVASSLAAGEDRYDPRAAL